MQIVIDIPDEVAKENTPKAYFEYFGAWSSNLTKAFENAIVLPKGHGELIDKDVVLDMMNHGILEEYINILGGVIPADKEQDT